MFNTGPDKVAIARINESLSTLQQARDLRIREAESTLKSSVILITVPEWRLNAKAGFRAFTELEYNVKPAQRDPRGPQRQ